MSTFDVAQYRKVLGHFPTGVTVVTGLTATQPNGLTIGSFTSVSLDPPLVGFLPMKTSDSWNDIRPSGAFCVNVLAESQQQVCASFARTGVDKFAGIDIEPAGRVNAPRITGALAHLECEIADVHEAGDHLIVIGRVVALCHKDGSPLMFYGGTYGRFIQGLQRCVA